MYKSPNKSLWTGRVDELVGEDGFRWHQIVKCINLAQDEIPQNKNNIALLGFACDEGVRRNKGRTGAAGGPTHLRKALANLADHFLAETKLYDAGDIVCENDRMEEAQDELAKHVQMLLGKNCFPILLGGGHEIAYGHFMGIANHLKSSEKNKIGIINFDAHFDLRSYENKGNSGTPFLQIAHECEKRNVPFNYMALGIQPGSNTNALFKIAESLNVNFLTVKDISQNSLEETEYYLDDFISENDFIYLTICLDVIAAPFAPGVSAPAINGLLPEIVLFLAEHILTSNKVISFDIAELNPKYDIDGRTAKLAAAIVYNMATGIFEPKQKEMK
jgi:formiminoglutamase